MRGFLTYYALADNLKSMAAKILRLTTTSFFHTLVRKGRSSVAKVARSFKRGPGHYVLRLTQKGMDTLTKSPICSPIAAAANSVNGCSRNTARGAPPEAVPSKSITYENSKSFNTKKRGNA